MDPFVLSSDNIPAILCRSELTDLDDIKRQLLRRDMDKAPKNASLLTPEERTRQLNAALEVMGDGLSQAQPDDMTAAMTEE